MGGSNWHAGSDEDVRNHLSQTLRDLGGEGKGGNSSSEIFGSERAAYLSLVKQYHPNRFARRPADIQRLSNEVFIALKDYFENQSAEPESTPIEPPKVMTGRDKTRRNKASGKDKLRAARAKARRARGSSLVPSALKASPSERGSAKAAEPASPADSAVAAATGPDATELAFAKAKQSLADGHTEQAAGEFRELVSIKSNDKRFKLYMHTVAAIIWMRKGEFDRSQRELDRAMAIDASFTLAGETQKELESAKKSNGFFSRLFGR